MPLVLVTPPATEPVTIDELKLHCQIDAGNQEPVPEAVTAALAGAGAGNVDNGAHRYLTTFVTAAGETAAGEISAAVTVADKTANGKVALTGIPLGGSAVTARKLYRTAAAGTTYGLLTTLADNSTTTYTDNIADASLGAGAPSTNSTGDPLMIMLIAMARVAAETITRRALITQTWDLVLDGFRCREIFVPKPTLQSVTSITYVDSNGDLQTLDPATYLVDVKSEPGRITPAFGLVWPSTRGQMNAVTVRYVCGYGAATAVPQGIKLWMLRRIKTLWDSRTNVDMDTYIKTAEMPPAFIDGLLDPYAVPHYCWMA